jgi:hypothetical protein
MIVLLHKSVYLQHHVKGNLMRICAVSYKDSSSTMSYFTSKMIAAVTGTLTRTNNI